MAAYALAGLLAVFTLMLVTIESWYALAKDSLAMMLVYAAVGGLALLGLWWIGWVG
jgi:hypothetical protein